MKIAPLTKDKIRDGWSGNADAISPEDVAGAIRWLRLEIDNLYRKFNKGDVWRWSNDEVCDKCEEYVMKKIEEAFPDLSILPEAKEHNNDFKKPCKYCNGKGYPNVLGERIYSHGCCHCEGTGFIKS